jgi:nucleoside-diphosphate-sugar epimerase
MQQPASNWCGRRVLITGGAGYLGGAIVKELLSRGAEVIGLVRNRHSAAAFARHQLAGKIHIIHGRAEDLFRVHSALAVHEAQAVFHLAAHEPISLDRGTTTVLEAVRRYHPQVPVVLAQPAAAAPMSLSSVPLGVARFGELLGTGEGTTRRFMPAAIRALINDERVSLTAERGPRDYVHVRDAARACLLLAESVAGRPTPHVLEAQFRSGWALTDVEAIEVLREAIAGRPVRASFPTSQANPLGWSPALNFSDAIADTVDWCRTQARAPLSVIRIPEAKRRAAA